MRYAKVTLDISWDDCGNALVTGNAMVRDSLDYATDVNVIGCEGSELHLVDGEGNDSPSPTRFCRVTLLVAYEDYGQGTVDALDFVLGAIADNDLDLFNVLDYESEPLRLVAENGETA